MSEKEGYGGMIFVVLFMVVPMVLGVWYFMPKEGEVEVKIGESFGPYTYKGLIGGGFAHDKIVIEYNGSEYYYSPQSDIELDLEYIYHIRLTGEGNLLVHLKMQKEEQ